MMKRYQRLNEDMEEVLNDFKKAGWKYFYMTGSHTKIINDIKFEIRFSYHKNLYNAYQLPIDQLLFSLGSSSESHLMMGKAMYNKGPLKLKPDYKWYLKDSNILQAYKKYCEIKSR